MKRSKVSILGAGVIALALAATMAGPAAADPSPQPKDIVGGGSDTTMFAMNNVADGATYGGFTVAGYNAAASARLVSWDAAPTGTIVPKVGYGAIPRPNGSGGGKRLLYGANNNTAMNYARSSSGLSQTEKDNNLYLIPFAVDGMKMAVRTAGSNAPASLTGAQVVGIYEGTYTNWSQLGGQPGTIVPMIPQSDSGTGTVFRAQLEALKGGPLSYTSSLVIVQEHDAAPVAADANAIAPFSTGRAASEPTVSLVGGWAYLRGLYNVVRQGDLGSPWFSSIFGSDGFLCSGSGLQLIQAAGFNQLAHPLDGGECGVPTQDDTTNFAVN